MGEEEVHHRTDLYHKVRQKYGNFIDKCVQKAYDAVEDDETTVINKLEDIAEEYTPNNIQPEYEGEVEDVFLDQYRMYNNAEDGGEYPLLYAVEDTVAYIFKARLDYDEE